MYTVKKSAVSGTLFFVHFQHSYITRKPGGIKSARSCSSICIIDDAGHQFIMSAMTAFSTPLFFSQMPAISASGSGQVPMPTSTVTAGIPLFTFSQLLNAPSSKDPS